MLNEEEGLENFLDRTLLTDQEEGEARGRRFPTAEASRDRFGGRRVRDLAAAATNQIGTQNQDERVQLLSTSGARGLSFRPAPPGRASMELAAPAIHCPF